MTQDLSRIDKQIDQMFRDGAKVRRFVRERLTINQQMFVADMGEGFSDDQICAKRKVSYAQLRAIKDRITEEMKDAGLCWGKIITVKPKNHG